MAARCCARAIEIVSPARAGTAAGRFLERYGAARNPWQRAVRAGRVRSIAAVEIESPDPERIAGRWGAILERPVRDLGSGKRRISLDAGAIDFLPSVNSEEIFAGVILESAERAERAVEACGVRFRLASAP